jgi:hypothetical protein
MWRWKSICVNCKCMCMRDGVVRCSSVIRDFNAYGMRSCALGGTTITARTSRPARPIWSQEKAIGLLEVQNYGVSESGDWGHYSVFGVIIASFRDLRRTCQPTLGNSGMGSFNPSGVVAV